MCVVLFLLYFCTEKCYILLLFPNTSISSRFTDGVCTFTRSAAHLLTFFFFFPPYFCIVVSHCYVRFDSISASKRSPPLFVLFFFCLLLLIMCYNCAFASSSSSIVFNTTRVFPMSLRMCVLFALKILTFL